MNLNASLRGAIVAVGGLLVVAGVALANGEPGETDDSSGPGDGGSGGDNSGPGGGGDSGGNSGPGGGDSGSDD